MNILAVALVAAAVTGISSMATVSGTVVDPQDLPVAAQTIALTCGDQTLSAQTDRRGRFMFAAAPESSDCSIAIEREGFVPVHDAVSRGADTRIRLRLAGVKEAVIVAPAKTLRPLLTGVELGEADLQDFAGNTADLIRHAKFLAGATTTATIVYVDGLPRSVLPPLSTVASISVNADAFSAEYADGDVTTIRIVTRAPSRAFRIMPSTDLLGFGGGNTLSSRAQTDSTSGGVGVMGAIPHAPITFTARANGGRTSADVPIQAVVPAALTTDMRREATAASVSRNGSGSIDLFYAPAPAFRANVAYRLSHNEGSNLGVGGVVVREAGLASTFDTGELRLGVSRFSGAFAYEGGVVATHFDSSTRANADELGIVVGGDAIVGGAATSATHSARTRWTSKHVVRAMTDRPWSVGVLATGAVDRNQVTPNAHGTFQVESVDAYERAAAGEPVGTWFATRGAADARYSALTLSPFVQKTLVRDARVEVNAGVRGDYHSRLGLFMSPRVSVATRVRGFTIGGGSGVFATPVPDGVFMRVLENDGVHLQHLVASGVSLADTAALRATRMPGVRSTLDADLARPYELMERVSIERPFGRFVPGIEITWTQDRRLLGVTRALDGETPADVARADFVDTFESTRRGERVRLHAQARYAVKRQMFAAHYEWVRARDNTDGPFSYATDPRNLDADWGPGSGLAAHNVTMTGSVTLPKSIALTVTDAWNSGAAYNITTGFDPSGTGLFIDRGGLARNSGDGPSYHSLSMYAHRRIGLPQALAHGRVHVNVGVQADNILDNRNYVSIGSVLSSSSFGRPLAAMNGRSIRVLLNVD